MVLNTTPDSQVQGQWKACEFILKADDWKTFQKERSLWFHSFFHSALSPCICDQGGTVNDKGLKTASKRVVYFDSLF